MRSFARALVFAVVARPLGGAVRTFAVAARLFHQSTLLGMTLGLSKGRVRVTLAVVCLAIATTASAQTSNAETLFKEAQSREAVLRREIDTRKAGAPATPLLERVRTLVGAYDDMSRLFPRSSFSDNSLWQGAVLAADAFWEFGQPADRATALRLFKALTTRFPASPLIRQIAAQTDRLNAAKVVPERAAAAPPATAPPAAATVEAPVAPPPAALVARPIALPGASPVAAPLPQSIPAAPPASAAAAAKQTAIMLTAIRREVLAGALRVTIALEGEAAYHDEQIDGPPRVFIDLLNTRPVDALKDVTQSFPDDVVRQIRVGRPIGGRTRVVLDLTGTPPHTTYALYNPYRVVIDFARDVTAIRDTGVKDTKTISTTKDITNTKAQDTKPVEQKSAGRVATAPKSAAVAPAEAADADPAPLPPAVNGRGGFSLSRQLGLGVARVVIDPGHGGHDPGAMTSDISEADLVLDVSLRLEKLLLKQPGIEVVMTRRTNVFVPLEERTAMANREGADLFLSIHANASEDDRARGIETYFLNFAPNQAAESVAARENAASARTMRQLPDIVKAIALNDKIDESRDFASLVQSSMMDRLKRANKGVKDLGVKQAPFMVLIGATMPSILAEISFLTNRQEAALLRGSAYRQQIAEALFNGVMRYQKSLKAAQTIAEQ